MGASGYTDRDHDIFYRGSFLFLSVNEKNKRVLVMLDIKNLGFRYRKTDILKDIRFELDKGEIISIVGPDGVGKSTLLKCIARILKPGQGSVIIDGKDAAGMKSSELVKCIGYVPQDFPSRFPLTVFEAILMGRRPYITWRPSYNDLKIVSDLIDLMGLTDLAMQDFDCLSGGQKQKVLLARAFAQETDLLLLDEPTSNLDLKHQLEVMEMISGMLLRASKNVKNIIEVSAYSSMSLERILKSLIRCLRRHQKLMPCSFTDQQKHSGII